MSAGQWQEHCEASAAVVGNGTWRELPVLSPHRTLVTLQAWGSAIAGEHSGTHKITLEAASTEVTR